MVTPTRFEVEYTYQRQGGSPCRSRLTTTVNQLANPAARSETAVLAYLRKRHPNTEITILDLSYQTASGQKV